MITSQYVGDVCILVLPSIQMSVTLRVKLTLVKLKKSSVKWSTLSLRIKNKEPVIVFAVCDTEPTNGINTINSK